MPPKTRKRKPREGELVLSDISSHESAKAAVRYLKEQFALDTGNSEDGASEEESTSVSFSKTTFRAIAPLVGLKAFNELLDIETFLICRSRIPNDLFKSIVKDMDVMLVQYGPPKAHKSEEARSRFFSPVFNHLVKQFTFMMRNEPETIISGRISTSGRIEYFFKTFGATAILCIEMKFKIGNQDERLEAIAQVIAECDGCYEHNTDQGYSLPIHCILSDGLSYEFFKFERTPNPRFFRGCFAGDPKHLRLGLHLGDFTETETSLPFILQLRRACETVFDTMLCAYISGLKAYHTVSEAKGKKTGSKRLSLDGWDDALKSAESALRIFRAAEVLRQNGDLDSADNNVQEALDALQESTERIPTVYKTSLIMTDWDDDEVRKG